MYVHEEEFIFPCMLPPTDNNLTRSGRFGKYPVDDYRDWLITQSEALDEYLEGWTADPALWWQLRIYLWLKTGDGSNRVKAAQDLLAGRRFDKKTRKIVDGPGLFANDKQVRGASVWIEAIRVGEPRCQIEAVCVDGPKDERAEADAAEKAAKLEARLQAVRDREAAHEQAKVAAKAAKERAEAMAAEFIRERILALLVSGSYAPWAVSHIHGGLVAESQTLGATPPSLGAVKRRLAVLEADGAVRREKGGWRLTK